MRKFNFGSTGIRRKAILVARTCCNKCGHIFLDKVYELGRHVVICPRCKKVNAITDYDNMKRLVDISEAYDSGMLGSMGGISRYIDEVVFKKKEFQKFKMLEALNQIKKGEKNENKKR